MPKLIFYTKPTCTACRKARAFLASAALVPWILVGALAGVSDAAAQERAHAPDEFFWLGEINKASLVMLVEQQVVPPPLDAHIAGAIAKVMRDGATPGAARPGDYLDFEQLLIKAGGPDVTRVHSGRSRQDIKGTIRRLFMRDAALTSFERLIEARASLLALAEAHRNAVIPAYTYGVQAQPTTLGHYLTAYAAALARTADRYREAYPRVNQSQLGSAALGTSSFPVDRPRLSDLLGFDRAIDNSFDANQLAPLDTGLEVAGLTSTAAMTIGTLAADLTAQYTHVAPWLTLSGGNVTGISSIMPQKRNPTALVELRQQASTVAAAAFTYSMQSHNVASGMEDYKMATPTEALLESARLYDALATLINALRVDERRALDEVNADYSTTTELADTLQRTADVPFRVGHHFASELVNYGRSRQLRPAAIPYAEAQRIYRESAARFDQRPADLPLSESQFRQSLSPEHMVQAARGLGGPQPAEVTRMLAAARAALAADRAWLASRRDALQRAAAARDAAFAGLLR